MGKQGPCCHCGISTTPLWRNGPPEKPVLCNACGSRWRTKGTLLNYMPMHSGGFGANAEASGDLKWSRGKKGSQKHAEQRSHKRKEPCDGPLERETAHFIADQLVSKGQEEEIASRSCSGSLISGSEGSVRRSSSSVGDLPALGPPWDAPVPSKKRSTIVRHPTPVDKLTKSLTSLLIDSGSIAHPVPSSSSEALLEYNKSSLVAVEIGLGSVFVRQPVSVAQESESETSSFLVESKGNESFNAIGHSESGGKTSLIQGFNGSEKGLALRGKDKAKQVPRKLEAGRLLNEKNLIPNKALLENFPYNKRDVLQSCQSPLVFLEMKDIVNFDTFMGLLTEQEQVYLMQFASSADVARIPESLKSMFSSAQFEGALLNFQQLVSEGMFDSSEPGLNPRVLQHYQQLLTLTDLTGSGWMERCSQLQSRSKRRGFMDCTKVTQNKESSKDKLKVMSLPGAAASASGGFYGPKQLSSNPYEQAGDFKPVKTNGFPGTGSSSMSTGLHNINPVKHGLTLNPEIGRPFNEADGVEAEAKSEVPCFPGNNSFLPTAERGPTEGDEDRAPTIEDEQRGPIIMEDEYMDIGGMDSGEVDSLLFDVPNPMSFQQAELLHQPSWSKTKSMKEDENDASQLESGGLIMSNTWHMDPNPADWGLFWNSSCVGPGRALPNGTVLNPGRMLM